MFHRGLLIAGIALLNGCGMAGGGLEKTTAPAAVSGTVADAAPPPAVKAVDGPPTINGVYVYPGCEGEGGCGYSNWRTLNPTPLLADQSPTAKVITTLTPGEWVHVEALETRLVPKRGRVMADGDGLKLGDVVYLLEYEGEGYSTLWRRGDYLTLSPEGPPIEWDDSTNPAIVPETLGLWAKVKRENGQIGWVHEPRFECMGQLAGDENCRG